MTGEPISTTLLIASAASTGAGLISSRKQEKSDLAFLEAETERAKLEATDQAMVQARGFRQALASQLAISSMRSGGGGSIARQFGAESVANFLKDQGVLERRKQFIDVAAKGGRANIKAERFSRDLNAVKGLISSGSDALNLSNFMKEGAKKAASGGTI